MARPRTPKAQAEATGRTKRDPARFVDRIEPVVAAGVGSPPTTLNEFGAKAWMEFVAELPWLNFSHRALLEIASTVRGRMMSGADVGVQAMNLLRQCLGQMGATPADASKAGMTKQDGDKPHDPADEFFD